MNDSNMKQIMPNSGGKGQSTLNDILTQNYAASSNAGMQTGQMSGAAAVGQAYGGPYASADTALQMASCPQCRMAALGTTVQNAAPSQQTQNSVLPSELAPITSTTQPMPQNVRNLQFLNGALNTQVGRRVTVSFLIGTNTFVDRTGTLLAVGANYILIREADSDDILFCDFFSIKFVKVYR